MPQSMTNRTLDLSTMEDRSPLSEGAASRAPNVPSSSLGNRTLNNLANSSMGLATEGRTVPDDEESEDDDDDDDDDDDKNLPGGAPASGTMSNRGASGVQHIDSAAVQLSELEKDVTQDGRDRRAVFLAYRELITPEDVSELLEILTSPPNHTGIFNRKTKEIVQKYHSSLRPVTGFLPANATIKSLRQMILRGWFNSNSPARLALVGVSPQPIEVRDPGDADNSHAARSLKARWGHMKKYEASRSLLGQSCMPHKEKMQIAAHKAEQSTPHIQPLGEAAPLVISKSSVTQIAISKAGHSTQPLGVTASNMPPRKPRSHRVASMPDLRRESEPALPWARTQGSRTGEIAYNDANARYPVFLPFVTQHKILTTTQRKLEETLFKFSHRWAPDILLQLGWRCSEQLELNTWWGLFKNCDVSSGALVHGPPLEYLFSRIAHIRHCAVHRSKDIPLGVIEAMVSDALSLTRCLRDEESSTEFYHLHANLLELYDWLKADLTSKGKYAQDELTSIGKEKKELEKRLAELQEREDAITRKMRSREMSELQGDALDNLIKILDQAAPLLGERLGEEGTPVPTSASSTTMVKLRNHGYEPPRQPMETQALGPPGQNTSKNVPSGDSGFGTLKAGKSGRETSRNSLPGSVRPPFNDPSRDPNSRHYNEINTMISSLLHDDDDDEETNDAKGNKKKRAHKTESESAQQVQKKPKLKSRTFIDLTGDDSD